MVDWHTLFEQASGTAQSYMVKAVKDIDEIFEEGYAEEHPDLIAAYMKVAAMDYNTAAMIKINEGEAW